MTENTPIETCKNIIDILSAILAPTIAIIGIWISIVNYNLLLRKRKDDLFDRRYKFLKDFERFWKTTGEEKYGATRPYLEWDDLEPWVQEARFLFGKDIAQHIKSYEGKSYKGGLHWVPDTELSKPFNKYLRFED